jgi:hypothetical protein
MPDYMLTSPEGQRAKLSVPDGVSDDELHSTLADALPSDSAQEARDVAAQRTKQATAPGQRKEGPITDYLVDMGESAKSQIEGFASDVAHHPENLVGTGEIGGIVRSGSRIATSGLRPFQTQQLLVQYNRDLAAGRITEEQFRARREALGLPAETPSYLRPVSAQPRVTTREPGSIPGSIASPPQRGMIREPSERTIAELHEVRQPPQPRKGFLGGDDSARQIFQDHIAHHVDEQQFAHKYFDGMYSRTIKLTNTAAGGLDFNGNLHRGGQSIGEIHRRIFPDRSVAVHDFLELNDDAQAAGIAKSLLRNQIDTYRAIGINHVNLTAGLNVGGYSWAKYGFLPDETAWRGLQTDLRDRMRYLRMDNDVRVGVEHLIESENPIALWRLSDMRQPVHRTISNDQVPAGKGLLLGQTWKGSLDLTNPEQMKRFDVYVK